MFPVKREVDLQADIIDTCIKLGGYGFKWNDKFLKGKPDVWLSLPSGVQIFAEVKVIRKARFTIRPEFTRLQLDCMGELTLRGIPAIGMVFVKQDTGGIEFKICPYMELKKLQETHNAIRYHISHFHRVRQLEDIITDLEAFFAGSVPQAVQMSKVLTETFYAECFNGH
jgi:hypothetical protein